MVIVAFQAIVNAASNVISLQRPNPIFDLLHPSGLTAACQHVHFGFQARQLLQHFALEVVVGNAHHERMLRGIVRMAFVGSISHKSTCRPGRPRPGKPKQCSQKRSFARRAG